MHSQECSRILCLLKYIPTGQIFSWNIRGTFPWYIPGIFGSHSPWNSGGYSQIMVREYWILGIFPKYSMNTLQMLHVSILTKCVGKISWPNVVGKFGAFYHKITKCRVLSIPSPADFKLLPAMTSFKEII